MSCPTHPAFDPTCHACIDSAAGQVGKTGHPMASGTATVPVCKACKAPRGPESAFTATKYCKNCGACFDCGAPGVSMSMAMHHCGEFRGPSTVVMGQNDILASGPTRPGYQHSPATWVEGREAPKREACDDHDPYCLSCAIADAATVEACARAAYIASWRDAVVLPWEMISEDDRRRCREVARAVLAAARGGR